MKSKPSYVISLLFALIPMLLGTIIFWTWFYYPQLHDLELWGFMTIIISIPICIVGLVLAFVVRAKNKGNAIMKRKTTVTVALTIANIPLAAFYVWFALFIMDTERITIMNNSDSDVTDINIYGVGNENKIDKIEKGRSKTVWVHMTSDGSIKMKYRQNEQIDTVILNGYTGPAMGGHKIKYNIKWTEEDLKYKNGS